MNDRTYIIREGKPDIDLYEAFSVFVAEGGYQELAAWPPLKKVAVNDWPEEDGSDPDLSGPKLDTRSLNIVFGCTDARMADDFLGYLATGAYHKFDFREIGLVKRLRLVSQPNIKSVGGLRTFTLQFADDLCDLQQEAPAAEGDITVPAAESQGVFIDGLDLAKSWGVSLLEGTMDSIGRAPAVKQNLLVNTSDHHGAWYDDAEVYFAEQKATLRLFLQAPDSRSFWSAYNGLLNKLIEPEERELYIGYSDEYYYFYYDSASVTRFTLIPGGGLWCEFSLNLNFTSYRPGHVENLLSAENGSLIEKEESTAVHSILIDAAGNEGRRGGMI